MCAFRCWLQVWPGATRSVLAVESSSAMSELGVRVETALKQLLVEEQEQLHAEEAEAQGGRRRIWGSRGRGADKRAPGPLVNWVRDLPSLKSAPQLKQKYEVLQGRAVLAFTASLQLAVIA